MASAYYVYAIVARTVTLPPELAGLNGEPLSLVPWQALASVVGVSTELSTRPTADMLLRHEAVVERLHDAMPALPVRFGTILPSDAAVTQALAECYEVLLSDLERVGDKVELGLTVLWGSDVPDDSDGDSQAARTAIYSESQGRGERYLLARRKAYRRERTMRTTAQVVASELDRRLRQHVRESRYIVDTLPGLALRAAYLVDRDMFTAARATLMECRSSYPALRFLITGPWPPYSFVSPPARQIEAAKKALAWTAMPTDTSSFAKKEEL